MKKIISKKILTKAMIKTVKVSEKGQIAIPRSVRENLGINKGDDLILLEVDNGILLEKTDKAEQMLKEDFKDILKLSEKSLKRIWDNKEDEIWNEYLR